MNKSNVQLQVSSCSRSIVLCATLIGMFCAYSHITASAQDQNTMSATDSPATGRPQSSDDPFILGPWLPVKALNSNEAIQWGVDFIVSPSTAKDRVVLYAYEIAGLDAEFFHRLNEQLVSERPKIAIISTSPLRNLAFPGTDIGSFCVPLILDARNEMVVRSFVSTISSPEKSERFLPAVIAVSAIKTGGIDLSGINNFGRLSIDRPWSPMIASSIPISGNYKRSRYVASSSGWDASRTPSQLMVTLSELEKIATH